MSSKVVNFFKNRDPNSVVRESELSMLLIEKLLNNK